MNIKQGISPAVNFVVQKFSGDGALIQEAFCKNVVLDVGWEHFMDRCFSSITNNHNSRNPDFLYLGTGTTEPTREDLGLEAVSAIVVPKIQSSMTWGGEFDPLTDERIVTWRETVHNYLPGEATGTWTELGLAFWDLIGNSAPARGINNTYTFPYSRSLFREGIEQDAGTASAGGSTTLSDATKAWDVDAWKDNYTVYIVGGTGTGQSREITGNTATELTVAAWDTAPDATSEYEIKGTPTSITVLADEYLTVVAYSYLRFPHPNHFNGIEFSIDGQARTITCTHSNQAVTNTGASYNMRNFSGLNMNLLLRTVGPSGGAIATNLNNAEIEIFPATRTKRWRWNLPPTTDDKIMLNIYINWTTFGHSYTLHFDNFTIPENERMQSEWWTITVTRAD